MLNSVAISTNKALGATFATKWIDARDARVLYVQWSSDNVSSPVGALTLEESNDPKVLADLVLDTESTSSTAKAIDITADSTRVASIGTGATVNAANNTEFVIHDPAPFVRVKYTRTSGGATATAQCWASSRK